MNKTIVPSIIALLVSVSACQPAAMNNANIAALSKPEQHLFTQAAEKYAQGQVDEAVNLYTQAAKLSKSSTEAHVAIAEILRAENKAAQSLPMLNDALKLQPDDARLYMEKGFALIATEKYDQAILEFNQALKLDANLASAYSGKGVALDMKGEHSQAQQVYSQAKARGLSSPAMENNYALSLIFSGQYDEAIAMLTPHVSSAYATPTMRQNLALAYGLKGDVGRAAQYGAEGLDPIKAKQNLEFYKQFSALKTNATTPQLAVSGTDKAAYVQPVESGDIGFVTSEGKSNEVVLKPNVEVIEMDAATFEQMVE